jgi:hypothetical protein
MMTTTMIVTDGVCATTLFGMMGMEGGGDLLYNQSFQ